MRRTFQRGDRGRPNPFELVDARELDRMRDKTRMWQATCILVVGVNILMGELLWTQARNLKALLSSNDRLQLTQLITESQPCEYRGTFAN